MSIFRPLLIATLLATTCAAADDPLPSWNDGLVKESILAFVERVTNEKDVDFVPVDERIATFDNDGTLWCEQPNYVQAMFVFDRVHELAPQRPEWKTTEPYKSVLDGDMKAVAASGEKGLAELVMATHAGMTVDSFDQIVRRWITRARHPKYNQPYTACVYQPMLELLAYLKSKGFQTFIVSGGGIDFMRPWTEKTYGVPPQRVVGSSIKTKYVDQPKPILMRLAELNFIDDGPGKPVGIQQHIGRRPILAFGNSDGDYEMLRYATTGTGARIGLIVHHTDAEREYAYDRDSHVGRLAKALDDAPKYGWSVVDMKRDWKKVFAFEK